MGVEPDAGAVDAGEAPPVGRVAAGHEVAAVVADDLGRFAGDARADSDVDGARRRARPKTKHRADSQHGNTAATKLVPLPCVAARVTMKGIVSTTVFCSSVVSLRSRTWSSPGLTSMVKPLVPACW